MRKIYLYDETIVTLLLTIIKKFCIGITCFSIAIISLLLELYPTLVSKMIIFESFYPLYNYMKTSSAILNTVILVLLGVYGVVNMSLSVVDFHLYKLRK